MSTAQRIVEKFGSQTALAAAIGKGQSVVAYWCKIGSIPQKWHAPILKIASEQNIDLAPSDFSTVSEPQIIEDENLGKIPIATYPGILPLGDEGVPVYVLNDGRRVVSRSGATGILTAGKGGGNLESYIGVHALKKYIPESVIDGMIDFSLPGVVNKTVKGIEAEAFIEICRGYVRALAGDIDGEKLTSASQIEIAVRCSMFLASCAKLGLVALIDEATGYQYDRAADALQIKLRAYLEEEMRKWERTFPNELWIEFGRLTRWGGTVNQRPLYWGKLVMELVYDYLDKDVADWLRKNAPKPRHGQNYHQWLTAQYGLKKLVEHIWMLIGMASACTSMRELRERMAEKFGRQSLQLTLYVPSSMTNQKFIPATSSAGKNPN
jgi:hypothetical protein